MLDNRLKMCAEMVSGHGTAVDVGTDHAYLAAELVMSRKCDRVIASDINEGPLEAARNTVEKNELSDKIELVLSDGLDNIDLKGVTDIIIAGMGGETIADILGRMTSGKAGHIRFILQPMTKVDFLRREVYKLGFRITTGKAVEDGDKIYVIMCVEECDAEHRWTEELTEFKSLYGFFEGYDSAAKRYRKNEGHRLQKISDNLEKSGRHCEAVHYSALARKMIYGAEPVSIKDVYNYLDTVYPFGLQMNWDNSGMLVQRSDDECSTVLLSLDITNQTVNEAVHKNADLMISHHPIIFDPLKSVDCKNPVWNLIYNNIAAICMHTNVDIAESGTNGVILAKLKENFEIVSVEPFEDLGNGNKCGSIVELSEAVSQRKLGEILKEMFGCEYVRMNRYGRKLVRRIAFCSGSGGSMLGLAVEKRCDALITGDVKHDVWIDANNRSIALFDCGHFHTENPVLWEFRRALESNFPQLDVEIAEKSLDPCEYV